MVERLGEMRKGRRERIEKGSSERIEKGRRERIEKRERDKKFEERGPERPLPFFWNCLEPVLQCSHCFIKSSGLELKHQNVVFTSL